MARKEQIGEFRAGKSPEQFYLERRHLKYFIKAENLARSHKPNAESYLDVGGGCCLFMNKFTGKRVVADIDPNGNLYSSDSGVEYVITDGSLKMFEDKSFDVVFCLQVIEHNSLNVDELFRVSKGIVIISYPYHWKSADKAHHMLDEKWLFRRVRKKPAQTIIAVDGSRKRSVNVYKFPFES